MVVVGTAAVPTAATAANAAADLLLLARLHRLEQIFLADLVVLET